ncbi:hypothetical protein C8Q80DRAFT_1270194 [Daedaleopsis nitida]|nr:hypothetical protein C8Q80DRAFT_1270194 [Daedaleopsis nitida]
MAPPRIMISTLRTIFNSPSDSDPSPPPLNQLRALDSLSTVSDQYPLFLPLSPAPDGNDSFNNDTFGMFNTHTQKRLKTYAHHLTLAFNLPEGALEEVTRATDLATMVLTSHIAILSARRIQRKYKNLVKLQDKECCTTVTNRLIRLLLSPNITAYLHGIHLHTMSLIAMNPEEFTVPEDMVTDADVLSKLSELITRLLCRARGHLKTKIQSSLAKKRKGGQNLIALSRAMLPPNLSIELRSTHMERIAWLRALFVIFSEQQDSKSASQSSAPTTPSTVDIPNSPEDDADVNAEDESSGAVEKQNDKNDKAYKKKQYWVFVDDSMLTSRQEFQEKYGSDPAKLHAVWSQGMAAVLADDLKLYPTPDNTPVKPSSEDRRVVVFPWQKFYEKNSTWP